MNSKNAESETISILINRPDLIRTITVDPNWFTVGDYRKIYQAINKKPSGSVTDWYIIAYNNFGFRSDDTVIYNLAKYAVTSNSSALKFYSNEMRKNYLRRKFNEFTNKYKKVPATETLKKIVECANKISSLGVGKDINHTPNALAGLEHDMNHSKSTGIKTFHELDYILGGGLYGGCLLTIGATTGTGKTSFAVNLAYQAMKNDSNIEVDYFTEEMTSRELLDRFISRMTGVSEYDLRDPYDRVKNPVLRKCVIKSIAKIKSSNLKIYDTAHSLNDIQSIIRQNAAQRKPNTYIAVVDYIGIVSVGNSNLERYLQIGKITRSLKMLTSDFNIPIIEITQLNREVNSRDDNEPQLSDIRESGSVEQDSNVVLFLYHKKKDSDIVTAKVAKNRAGITESVDYKFDKPKMKFSELPKSKVRKQNAKKFEGIF